MTVSYGFGKRCSSCGEQAAGATMSSRKRGDRLAGQRLAGGARDRAVVGQSNAKRVAVGDARRRRAQVSSGRPRLNALR